jgi:Domain of unknown function (DUF4262)
VRYIGRIDRIGPAPSQLRAVRASLGDVSDPMPDRAMEHRGKIAWMIETRGWAIEPVAAHPETDPPTPGYAYTIGFEAAFTFPEVAIFGLTPVAASGLAGLVAEFLGAGTELPVGALFTGLLDNDLRCALLPVDVGSHAHLFAAAVAWHGAADFHVVQLVWPDRNGWLPWESGFDQKLRLAEPVLGEPPS